MQSAFLICTLRAHRSPCLVSISAGDDRWPIDWSIPNRYWSRAGKKQQHMYHYLHPKAPPRLCVCSRALSWACGVPQYRRSPIMENRAQFSHLLNWEMHSQSSYLNVRQ